MQCRVWGLVLLSGLWAAAVQAERSDDELDRFVRDECGFCHGLKLTGGLGSPLTAQALAAKPEATLVASILYGIPGTAMPGWAGHLSQAEVQRIVQRLQRAASVGRADP